MADYEKDKEVFSVNLRTKLRNFVGLGQLRVGGLFDGGAFWGEAWTRYDWAEVQPQIERPHPPGWTELALSSQEVALKTSAKMALDAVQPDTPDKQSS